MKTTFYVGVSICLSLCLNTFAQIAHGPSARISYSTIEQYSFGLGYHFTSFKDEWGWKRPGNNYYLEYIPEFKAFGLSANVQYAFILGKVGLEVNFRSKNEKGDAYLVFFPHIGFEMINLDLSFGPDIVTTQVRDKSIGFKVFLKIHPKLFNQGSNRLNLKKT